MRIDEELGAAIEKLRRENEVDAVELARRMETAPSTVKRWIRYNYCRCSLAKIQEILEAIRFPEHTLPYLKKAR